MRLRDSSHGFKIEFQLLSTFSNSLDSISVTRFFIFLYQCIHVFIFVCLLYSDSSRYAIESDFYPLIMSFVILTSILTNHIGRRITKINSMHAYIYGYMNYVYIHFIYA